MSSSPASLQSPMGTRTSESPDFNIGDKVFYSMDNSKKKKTFAMACVDDVKSKFVQQKRGRSYWVHSYYLRFLYQHSGKKALWSYRRRVFHDSESFREEIGWNGDRNEQVFSDDASESEKDAQEIESSSSEDDDNDQEVENGQETENGQEIDNSKTFVNIEIPPSIVESVLKQERKYNKDDELKLPVPKHSLEALFRLYYKFRTIRLRRELKELWKWYLKSLEYYFNTMILEESLLFENEITHIKSCCKGKPPSEVFGYDHLCRLLLSIEDILNIHSGHIDEETHIQYSKMTMQLMKWLTTKYEEDGDDD